MVPKVEEPPQNEEAVQRPARPSAELKLASTIDPAARPAVKRPSPIMNRRSSDGMTGKQTLIPNFNSVTTTQNQEHKKAAPPKKTTETTPFFASNEKEKLNFADEMNQINISEPLSASVPKESIFRNVK